MSLMQSMNGENKQNNPGSIEEQYIVRNKLSHC